MKVLIVHAHHEPKSFCSALYQRAVDTLTDAGHEVVTSDLYAMAFDPVSDRRNFTTVADPDYLKQQMEERLASDQASFAPALDAEIVKLEACELLIFTFPLWWFGLPGILKGWVDRVFAMRRIYGDGKLYENGLGKAQRRAMVIMTTGGGPEAYGGYGLQPPLATVLTPIEHGVFWFNGFLPLEPFVAFSAPRISQDERTAYLNSLAQRLRHIAEEKPRSLPPMSDFASGGVDQKKRFMVTGVPLDMRDERLQSLLPAERARIAELRREGVLLSIFVAAPETPDWRVFLMFREISSEDVRKHLDSLPMAGIFDFQITELMRLT